ncbi:hypothetical protein D3C72_2399750 [compost metagenome]
MGQAVSERRIYRVFGQIALDSEIVVPLIVFGERPALNLHLMGRLPAAQRRFANPPHGLRIR